MDEPKVTPNSLEHVTPVTSGAAHEKNQQRPVPTGRPNLGAGADADNDDDADNDAGAGKGGLVAPSAPGTSVEHTDAGLSSSPLDSSSASVGAGIMRLLHEDGGGKSETPPDFAQALAKLCDAGHTLAQWAARYLAIKVCGRSPNTVAAKARDLATFIKWFVGEHGHGEIAKWVPRDTRRFMHALNDAGRQPTTINRALYTLKHFARWVHEQPGGVFQRFGLPVSEVEPYGVDEVDCKKLTPEQVEAVFAAAQAAIEPRTKKARRATTSQKQGRGAQTDAADGASNPVTDAQAHLAERRARPRRNLAVLGVLYYTGLRVSEVVALRRNQYDGECLHDVERKGGRRARKVMLHPECIRLVDDYLAYERGVDVGGGEGACPMRPGAPKPLFVTARAGKPLDRFGVRDMLAKLAQATGLTVMHKGRAVPMTLHPHQLRHTFGALYREASGSDTETAAALGHAGLQYVGRYVRQTDVERHDTLKRALRLAFAGAPQPAQKDGP